MIYRFKWLKGSVHVSVLLSNCKKSITSLSLLVGTTEAFKSKHSSTSKLLCTSSTGATPVGKLLKFYSCMFHYTPRKLCLWWGILFSRCACVRPSVTFCFLNILKSHCGIFLNPCKHVHICKTNTLNKKVRARGQFY